MNQQLFEIEETWKDCLLCKSLANNRLKQDEKIAFGAGYSDAIGLVITDIPYVGAKLETKQWEILNQIWNKVGIDQRDWYTASSVMCPTKGFPSKHEIGNCRKHVSEILLAISPAVVVLMGGESSYSFYGEEKLIMGLNEHPHYKLYRTPSITEYLLEVNNKSPHADVLARDIFRCWQQVTTAITSIKTE
jgi:uracil-DNA glycosylase